MIFLAGLIGGAAYGASRARARGGRPLDLAQYGAAYGIAFGILGIFVTVGLDRAM